MFLVIAWLFVDAATEIQNIQVADGDVCRKLPIPIYMIFPRLFTCPTLATSNFKIGKMFESELQSMFIHNVYNQEYLSYFKSLLICGFRNFVMISTL